MNYAILSAINSLPVNIAVVDVSGVIVAVNNGWKIFGRENGLKDARSCLGANYLDVCRASAASPVLIAELEDLLAARRHMMMRWYPCHHPDGLQRWFLLVGAHDDASGRVTLTHVDLSSIANRQTCSMLAEADAELRNRRTGL